MNIVIDDNLLERAQQISGLPDYRAVVEAALRALIEKQQKPTDVAGSLSRYARRPPLSFAQEREAAWSTIRDETPHT